MRTNCKTIYFLYRKCRVSNKRLGDPELRKIFKTKDKQAFEEFVTSYGSRMLPFFYLNKMILSILLVTPSADNASWKFEESKSRLYYKYSNNIMRTIYPNAVKNLFG